MPRALVHWFHRSGEAGDVPIVLLHGFTGAVSSWDQVAHKLVGVSVLGLHLPGHHPDAPVAATWQGNVDWAIDTLVAHGVRRCRLVGYSLGARTALGVLLRRPELVEHCLLIGVHPGLTSEQARTERRSADANWVRMLGGEGLESFVGRWEALPIFAHQSAEVCAEQRNVRLAHEPAGLAASLTHMGLAEMPDYRAEFSSTQVPVKVAAGEHDTKFAELARAFASDPISIPGCGHNAVAERPEAVAELIRGRLGVD